MGTLTDSKGALLSGTVIANLSGLGAILPVLLEEWQSGNLESAAKLLVAGIATLVSIWRRVKATKKVEGLI